MESETKQPELGVTQTPKTPKQLKTEFLAKYNTLCQEYGYRIAAKTTLDIEEL